MAAEMRAFSNWRSNHQALYSKGLKAPYRPTTVIQGVIGHFKVLVSDCNQSQELTFILFLLRYLGQASRWLEWNLLILASFPASHAKGIYGHVATEVYHSLNFLFGFEGLLVVVLICSWGKANRICWSFCIQQSPFTLRQPVYIKHKVLRLMDNMWVRKTTLFQMVQQGSFSSPACLHCTGGDPQSPACRQESYSSSAKEQTPLKWTGTMDSCSSEAKNQTDPPQLYK